MKGPFSPVISRYRRVTLSANAACCRISIRKSPPFALPDLSRVSRIIEKGLQTVRLSAYTGRETVHLLLIAGEISKAKDARLKSPGVWENDDNPNGTIIIRDMR